MRGTFLLTLVTKIHVDEIWYNKVLLVSVFIHLSDYVRREQAHVHIGQGGNSGSAKWDSVTIDMPG